jgi:hypothetical protein
MKRVNDRKSAQMQADTITQAIASTCMNFQSKYGRLLHGEIEVLTSYSHTITALQVEKQMNVPLLMQLYSDRICIFRERNTFLCFIELDTSEILPMYSDEPSKHGIHFFFNTFSYWIPDLYLVSGK